MLIGGGAGVGLIVAFALWPRQLSSDLATEAGEQAFGNFIKIARDGRITVAVPQAETGQGIWTALPQIVADELGAAWETIAVEPAPLINSYANPLATERVAGRRRLVVSPRDRKRRRGQSRRDRPRSAPSRRRSATPPRSPVRCWSEPLPTAGTSAPTNARPATDSCSTAAARSPSASLRRKRRTAARRRTRRSATPTKGRLAGQPLDRLDGPAKARGSWRFAGDVRLPGMLFASVRVAPPGGRLAGFRATRRGPRPACATSSRAKTGSPSRPTAGGHAERAIKAANPVFSGKPQPERHARLFERHARRRPGKATGSAAAIMRPPSKDRARSRRPIMSRRTRISGSSR